MNYAKFLLITIKNICRLHMFDAPVYEPVEKLNCTQPVKIISNSHDLNMKYYYTQRCNDSWSWHRWKNLHQRWLYRESLKAYADFHVMVLMSYFIQYSGGTDLYTIARNVFAKQWTIDILEDMNYVSFEEGDHIFGWHKGFAACDGWKNVCAVWLSVSYTMRILTASPMSNDYSES